MLLEKYALNVVVQIIYLCNIKLLFLLLSVNLCLLILIKSLVFLPKCLSCLGIYLLQRWCDLILFYYLYRNASMSHMPLGTPIVNNSFAYTYPENASKSYSQSKTSIKPKGQRPAPKVKVDLIFSESKEEK